VKCDKGGKAAQQVICTTEMAVSTITSQDQVNKLSAGSHITVLNFWADWSKPCEQTNDIFQKLSQKHPTLRYGQIEAEKVPDVTEKYNVLSVPYFVFLQGAKVIDQLEGVNIPALNEKVTKYAKESNAPATAPVPDKEPLKARLTKLVNFAPVMLFMKGTPDAPQCGFSKKTVALLRDEKVQFSSFNILSDEEVRQGLKEFSNWPTFPQLYVEGKLIGGLDIVKELVEQGEFKDMIPEKAKAQTLNERLESLIKSHPVMLFMKGNPEVPQCGFSSKIVSILKQEGITFGSFNILSDEEVRTGLKTYSNWPTYPQLYANGKLVGGLDIVKELQEAGELKDAVSA